MKHSIVGGKSQPEHFTYASQAARETSYSTTIPWARKLPVTQFPNLPISQFPNCVSPCLCDPVVKKSERSRGNERGGRTSG